MNDGDAFRWYVEKVADERRQMALKELSKIEPTFIPIVENPDYTQLLKLKRMKGDLMTELRKFAEESFTINNYDAVPIMIGDSPEEEKEVDERTEWAISDVKKGVFDSRDYGVRGTYYSDLTMTAEEDGLYVSVSHDEYCFKFNKRFMIEDMIAVLQKCLEKMDKEVKE